MDPLLSWNWPDRGLDIVAFDLGSFRSTLALAAASFLVSGSAAAVPFTIAGFGNSITCTRCNDGSYLADWVDTTPPVLPPGNPIGLVDPLDIVSSPLEDALIVLGALSAGDLIIYATGEDHQVDEEPGRHF